MGNICTLIIAIFLSILFHVSLASVVSTGDFNKDFVVTWASPGHVNISPDGRSTTLKLDTDSGSKMCSNEEFLFGKFDMKMKLVPGESAGTVTAFYLISDDYSNRDELDFEFLGNVAGQPYVLQTNVFTNGYGEREQRIHLWFDPTEDFHTYSIFWNIYQVVFFVDSVPIRTYRNHIEEGVAYPMSTPTTEQICIWDGSDWATDGGKVKVDWSKAPFIASFQDYQIDACVWNGNADDCRGDGPSNWWNHQNYSTLTDVQIKLYQMVMENHIIYDYCTDYPKFNNTPPKECSLSKY